MHTLAIARMNCMCPTSVKSLASVSIPNLVHPGNIFYPICIKGNSGMILENIRNSRDQAQSWLNNAFFD